MQAGNRRKRYERGVSIFIVALGLIFLLGVTGLAVDLATLYVARNEAQRAADAAALAGAHEFVLSGFSAGVVSASQAGSMSATQATVAGNANLIIGENPDLDPGNFNVPGAGSSTCPPATNVSGGCFDFTVQNDPRITVIVYKRMPTYFIRIFGIRTVPISVTATAEAYNGPNVSVPCIKPWLLANCDPNFPVPNTDPNYNQYCDLGVTFPSTSEYAGMEEYGSFFVNNNQVINPDSVGGSPRGAIGELFNIKPGSPTAANVPSQFQPVLLPNANLAGGYTCPTCAANDQSQAAGGNSGALYRENIECCSTQGIGCGLHAVSPITGNKVGPTGQAVDCLIHEQTTGVGQDCISLDPNASAICPSVSYDPTMPFTMYAGSANPYKPAGAELQTSDSLVTLPLYDGHQLCSGTCPSDVDIDVVGFLGLFIRYEGNPNNTVYAFVTAITYCGAGGPVPGSPPPIVAAPGTPIPVRLIHN